MITRPALNSGRLEIRPIRIPGRLQPGGRRPPPDGGAYRNSAVKRSSAQRRRGSASRSVGFCAAACVFAPGTASQAAETYVPDPGWICRREASEIACGRIGDLLKLKQTGSATLTAGPGWNMHGIFRSAENGIILWSNSTTWRSQQTGKDGGTKS